MGKIRSMEAPMHGKGFEYTQAMTTILQRIIESQMEAIEHAARIVADAIAADGILYTFGTGHSHVIAEDVADRAGGLAPVDAILEASLTGHEKVRPSEFMERVGGMAEAGGLPVIAITSLAHSQGTTSRHSSGKKLYQIADVVIDNHCPKGDAMIQMPGLAIPVGPGSGVAGMFIIHTIVVQTIQELIERGVEPPVFMSGNLDGAD